MNFVARLNYLQTDYVYDATWGNIFCIVYLRFCPHLAVTFDNEGKFSEIIFKRRKLIREERKQLI